jgi:glycerophosphoryl diester phosphodiesterase
MVLIIVLPALAYLAFLLIGGGFGYKAESLQLTNDDKAVFLFAHRGITEQYPENSREAIQHAKKMGFKGLEIDIRKSADNEFILFHDEDGRRLLGLDSRISDLTTGQLKSHFLIHHDKVSQSSVITLNEMLDEFKDSFILYFDMKDAGFSEIDEMVSKIWSYGISRSVILASTSPSVIFYTEYHYPSINTALEGFNAGKEWTWGLIPKKLKPDFLSGFASKVNEDHVKWLRKRNLISKRIVYGVDSSNYQEMTELGLRNMIIDYWPGLR